MNKYIKYIISIPKRLAVKMIELYQRVISPHLKPSCKFYPTCSEYTRQAIDKYGIIKGSFLGIKRILKCNPFSNGGIDNLK